MNHTKEKLWNNFIAADEEHAGEQEVQHERDQQSIISFIPAATEVTFQ